MPGFAIGDSEARIVIHSIGTAATIPVVATTMSISDVVIAYQRLRCQRKAQCRPGTPSNAVAHFGGTTTAGEGLIPCDGADCTVNSVMQLLNNLMHFFFTVLLLPIFVVMVMYLGFGYLTAEGNPSQHAKLISMAKNMFLGLLLMLCAWLIVHIILSVLGYTDTLNFFGS